MTHDAKTAVRVHFGAFAALFVLAVIGNFVAEDIPLWLRIGATVFIAVLFFGQFLCWRAGWKRYNAESAPFAGKRLDKFVVYVLFAPITLLFSDITFPKWRF